jgi:tripartite-type tricarboxylate transporter receptor subunit TctC
VLAQDYPNRAITLIIPASPGGHGDTMMRILQAPLEEKLGQKIIIQHRPGGSGIVGTQIGMNAEPDGYTMTYHTSTTSLLNQFTKKLDFDLMSMAPITQVATWPSVVMLSAAVPANTPKEWVDLIKAEPGKYKYNSAGNGTVSHLLGAAFALRTEADMVHVPYSSGSEVMISLAQGETQMNVGGADALAGAPGVKALCVVSAERQKTLPDVPTCDEGGVQNYTLGGIWGALFFPPNTPEEIAVTLSAAIHEVLVDPEIVAKYAAIGDTVVGSSPADFRERWEEQATAWKELIDAIGVKP